MTVNIDHACSNILTSIRTSCLNYSSQETPYSIYITIRKSWKRDYQTHQAPLEQVQKKQQDGLNIKLVEVDTLNHELQSVRADLDTATKINNDLQRKLEEAVSKDNRNHKEAEKLIARKDGECAALKKSIKNESLKRELKDVNKVLKSKEKEIYNFETFKYNNQDAVKMAKTDAKEQKAEKEKQIKKVNMLEKKLDNLQKQINSTLEKNNNIKNSDSCLSSQSNISIPTTNSVAASTILSNPVSTIQPSPTLLSSSVSLPCSPDNSCKHQPQCVVRYQSPLQLKSVQYLCTTALNTMNTS